MVAQGHVVHAWFALHSDTVLIHVQLRLRRCARIVRVYAVGMSLSRIEHLSPRDFQHSGVPVVKHVCERDDPWWHCVRLEVTMDTIELPGPLRSCTAGSW